MKLKGKIATLLLASTLLTASLTACKTQPNNEENIDNTTTENSTLQGQTGIPGKDQTLF